jgi:FkbM family methyltransferase
MVIAVEPHPENVHLLELNLRLNRVSNVKVVPIAISDEIGTAQMFVSQGSNWHFPLANGMEQRAINHSVNDHR